MHLEHQPPVAATKDKSLQHHGHERNDPYYWLRDRESDEVIAYLNAENAYTESVMAHTKTLQEEIFEEIKGRIKQTDNSVPYKKKNHYYYTRFEDGKAYPIYCRKHRNLDAPEQIMLDVNKMAEGHEFFSVRGLSVSPDENLLAFAVDTRGRRIYDIKFMDLRTGDMLPDVIEDVTSNKTWANDNKTIFYTRQDPVTLRSYQILRHTLGTEQSADVKVFEEKDDTFSCYCYKTKTDAYILIASMQTVSSEFHALDANDPTGDFRVLLPRERDHEYTVDHFGDHFYIVTNDKAKNFRLVKAPVSQPTRNNWIEVIPHREDVLLNGIEVFNNFLVANERKNGLINMHVMPWDGAEPHDLDFGEPAYLAYVSTNVEMDSEVLRYGYTSMATPNTIYDYNMRTREKTQMKQDEVKGFKQGDYITERLYADARDGTKVPVSIVYRKGFEQNGKAPLLLYAYGSYGSSSDATFSAARLSLLDRGFAYAIAHVRGGQEMGRHWYEDGKLLKKKNTFTDFIDCGQFLVDQAYTSPDRLYGFGGSAGGLLIGAVANMKPELFDGLMAAVPFVDVVTTMLDEDIPLTTGEYDEWGNPNEQVFYDYMLSYSPYDNVEAKDYPNMLVTTGLHDSQVQYWEPAKWVAKLRAMKTDDNQLLLKTNMDAGHGGASGRYKRYEETAFRFAFLINLAERHQ
ncbi:MAG: S9 family peptidase [Phycisphaerae bacterium]